MEQSARKQIAVYVPTNDWVNRRILTGKNGDIIKKIAGEFGVQINPRISKNPQVLVKGKSKEVVTAVDDIIRRLDQQAGLIAKEDGLKGKKDITDKHFDLMSVHVAPLILKAKQALGLPVNQQKAETLAVKTEEATRLPADPRKGMFDEGKMPAVVKSDKISVKSPVKLRGAFEPRNQSQALTYVASKDPENSYVYAVGPFGGGKTFTPLRAAFEGYNEGRFKQIIVIRPTTTASKNNPGAMPGNPRAKIDPYVKGGVGDNIQKITMATMQDLEGKGIVRALTPDFERGTTYDRAFILVDEPQNLTVSEAELLIGRLGEKSLMVFAGDIGGNQNDLRGELSGLAHLIATQGMGSLTNKILAHAVAFIQFKPEDSAARNGILPHVSRALTEPPAEYAAFLKTIREARRDFHLATAIEGAREYGVKALEKAAESTLFRYELTAQATYPHLWAQDMGNVHVLRPGTASQRKVGLGS